MIIKCDWLFIYILKGYAGITLWPFIFVKSTTTTKIIEHEKVHYQQQKKLLVVFFYIAYISQYLFYLVKYRNHDKAYYSISFEQEAYLISDGAPFEVFYQNLMKE